MPCTLLQRIKFVFPKLPTHARATQRTIKLLGSSLLLALAIWSVVPTLPKPVFAQFYPSSTAITARGGELLRLTLASDQQYRLWVPLQHIPESLRKGTLLYEDDWFYQHLGVNPLALLRSAWMTYVRGGHQGASTISMQVARKVYAINSRTLGGKLRQIAAAFWLEWCYSKDELLEVYLNSAPYGGNIAGVATASLIYFHKPVEQLTLPEALTLAVIPQNPVRRFPNRHGFKHTLPPDLLNARQRLWQRWQQAFPQDQRYAADFTLPLTVYARADKAFIAPHLTQYLLQHYPSETQMKSSIDLPVQNSIKRSVDEYLRQHHAAGVRNAAVLLVDTQTMQVNALLGSANFWDATINGQVNGTQAKRSPGSTLKPFIYALALDQGLIHPHSILADTPTALGAYNPENFDNRFLGPITVQDALIRSRNIPAVKMTALLKQPSLYDFLAQAGIAGLKSEQHYGLSLALGGGEVTMLELAQLYALLRNQGKLYPLAFRADQAIDPESVAQLLSPAAAYITLDMLRHNPRPDSKRPALPTVAWKTGTSWGFKDAWAVGIVGQYALVVWTGNFNNRGNTAFVGIQTAAPLFFTLVDSLRSQRLLAGLETTLPEPVPGSITQVEVCAASGDLPNSDCPTLTKTWFIPGTSPIKISSLHRAVYFDRQSGAVVCKDQPDSRREVYEFWPDDMAHLFLEAGMPRRQPPLLPSCYNAVGGRADHLDIVSPTLGGTYTLRSSKPTPIALRVNSSSSGEVFWFANKSYLGKADSALPFSWSPPAAQHYLIRALDAQGHSASRDINVAFVP